MLHIDSNIDFYMSGGIPYAYGVPANTPAIHWTPSAEWKSYFLNVSPLLDFDRNDMGRHLSVEEEVLVWSSLRANKELLYSL